MDDHKSLCYENNIFCLVAIILQLGAFSSILSVFYRGSMGREHVDTTLVMFNLIILFCASVWMTKSHLKVQQDKHRYKNLIIESVYSAIQLIVVLVALRHRYIIMGKICLFVVFLLYVFVVNPKIMHRALVKMYKKKGKRQ